MKALHLRGLRGFCYASDQNQAEIYFKQIKVYLEKVILHGVVPRFTIPAPSKNKDRQRLRRLRFKSSNIRENQN